MSLAAGSPRSEVAWTADADDARALERRSDWSALPGLEQLWPVLADRYGDALALDAPHADPPERISYGELRNRIERAAAGFAALGVAPGDVVALFAENGPRWFVADQGLMRAGAADAVRGSSAPEEELRYILGDSGSVGLVVETAALLARLELDSALAEGLRFVVVLEGEAGPDLADGRIPCHRWDDLLALGATADLPPPPVDPQRLATILYTSGTTGQPKGVMHTFGNFAWALNAGIERIPMTGADRMLSYLPLAHVVERVLVEHGWLRLSLIHI